MVARSKSVHSTILLALGFPVQVCRSPAPDATFKATLLPSHKQAMGWPSSVLWICNNDKRRAYLLHLDYLIDRGNCYSNHIETASTLNSSHIPGLEVPASASWTAILKFKSRMLSAELSRNSGRSKTAGCLSDRL